MTAGRLELRRGAELLALTGLAITQPLLDVLGKSPETFVFRGVEGGAIVVFALVVALVPALVLWLIGLASGLLGPRVRTVVQTATVIGLVTVGVLVGVRLADLASGAAALAIALVGGALGGLLYIRVSQVRLFLLYLSPLPLVAAALFCFSSSVSGLVTGGETEVAEDVDSTQPVVMLVLDEFPVASLLDGEGAVDAEQFPAFARLSRSATWYRNYTTHNAGTVQAVPSLLSGRLPRRGAAPLYTDWPENLFTFLGGSYDMAVQETVTQLCPPDVCDGASRTVTRQTRVTDEGFGGLTDDSFEVLRQLVSLNAEPEVQVAAFTEEVISVPTAEQVTGDDRGEVTNQPTRFADFLDSMVEGEDPTFHFVHLILPHGPWRFFPDGTEYGSPDADPEGEIAGTWTTEWPAELTRFRLELQAEYTDALVGQTIDRMRETGLWDEALFVVVADHGGAFVPGEPGRAIGATNMPDVMWTPLFIRTPALAPGPVDTDVEASDLLPTIADLLGVELPYESDGQSAVSAPDTSGEKRYQRLQNPFQVEPDALLSIPTAENLQRVLTEPWPEVDAEDPVAGFYARYELASLMGRPTSDLTVGSPAGSADFAQLAELRDGTDGPLPAYLGGSIDAPGAGAEDWVVVAVDGTVAGYSALFPGIDSETSFGLLLAEDVVAGGGPHDVDLFLATTPDAPLRPLTLP